MHEGLGDSAAGARWTHVRSDGVGSGDRRHRPRTLASGGGGTRGAALALRLRFTTVASFNQECLLDQSSDWKEAERLAARSAKDFARSDAIRDKLLAQSVTIQDTPQGST